tara:strand:+ start:364 stop:543 length:180 start_codon:yes stop_codon:yes gene_type:complete
MIHYDLKADRIEPRLPEGQTKGTIADLQPTVVSWNMILGDVSEFERKEILKLIEKFNDE